MKRMKKLASFLLAMVMIVTMSMTAFADGTDGTITIENATKGKDYSIYKIFDATVSESGAVAYTIETNSDWYSLVAAKTNLFTLSQVDSDTYGVVMNETTTNVEDEIIKWLKSADVATAVAGMSATATQNALDTTVEFTGLSYGYYYITSALGSVITVDNVTKSAMVIDKNQAPGWDPENPSDPNTSDDSGVGKFVADTQTDATADTYKKSNIASINDTVYFKINAVVPKYAGPDQVHTYIFEDTLAAGLTYSTNSMVVTLYNEDNANGKTLTSGTDYEVITSGQTITIKVYAYKITDYPATAHLTIKYEAQVNKDAEYTNVNTVSMDWTVVDPDNPTATEGIDPEAGEESTDDPDTPAEPQDSTTTTYVYGFELKKVDGDGNQLTGAKFELYKADESTKIAVVEKSTGVYRVAVSGETGVDIEAGTVKIFGLDAGTYKLKETVAPDGYNLLAGFTTVTISADGDTDADGYMNAQIKVENKAGTELPTTGGIGTTIFYIVGGILVLGAVVVLVARKRMDAEE